MRRYPLDPRDVETLVARRKALGWTQVQLALETATVAPPGLTASVISQFECLRTGISPAARQVLERTLSRAEAQGRSRGRAAPQRQGRRAPQERRQAAGSGQG